MARNQPLIEPLFLFWKLSFSVACLRSKFEMSVFLAHPSPAPGGAPGAWNAPSYSTPYQNPGNIFSPVGTIQHTNMFPNTQQQIQMYPTNLSPTIMTHALQPASDSIFSVNQLSVTQSSDSAGKSKIELELEQQIADAKKNHRCFPVVPALYISC